MDFEKEVEQFCDNYCKYPQICKGQDELEEKCDVCPICCLVERLEQALTPQSSSKPNWQDKIMSTFLGGK